VEPDAQLAGERTNALKIVDQPGIGRASRRDYRGEVAFAAAEGRLQAGSCELSTFGVDDERIHPDHVECLGH